MNKEIEKLLLASGVKKENFVIGTAKPDTVFTEQFTYAAGGQKEIIQKTAKVAAKYFPGQKMILIWSVEAFSDGRMVKRSTFSVKKDSVYADFEKRVTEKAVEFPGRGNEFVWIYPTEELEMAVNKIKELLK